MLARPLRQGLTRTLAFLVTVSFCCSNQLAAQETETAFWQGTLTDGARKLLLKFEFHKDGDAWKGTIHSPDEGHIEIPITKMEMSESELTFTAPMVAAKFVGKLNDDKSVASGTWTQRGSDLDFEIKRVDSLELPELIEFWKGTLKIGEASLEMGLKVYTAKDGTLIAKLDSYSQGQTGIPVGIKRDGDKYTVTLKGARMTYEATVSDDMETLSGTFKQAGVEAPLDMKREGLDHKPKLNRPQTPKGPYPYDAADVSYENKTDGVTLGATLTTPKGYGPFPAAILISGSGSQDRDETIFEHKPFLVIADYLTRRGIAILRFDDRGVGESTGQELAARSTSQDFARDVQAGIDFLKAHDKIDASKIGLIGHSEGGMIAPLVATQGDDVAFIVSLAGPGVDGATILSTQIRAGLEAAELEPEFVEANVDIINAIIKLVKSDDAVSEEAFKKIASEIAAGCDAETAKQIEDGIDVMGVMFSSPWMEYFINYDPAPVWKKVQCPVLAINGEKDLQILVDLNLNGIEKALQDGGNRNFKIQRMPKMNHLFQETEGPGVGLEYGQLEQTFSPRALKVIGEWLDDVVK